MSRDCSARGVCDLLEGARRSEASQTDVSAPLVAVVVVEFRLALCLMAEAGKVAIQTARAFASSS